MEGILRPVLRTRRSRAPSSRSCAGEPTPRGSAARGRHDWWAPTGSRFGYFFGCGDQTAGKALSEARRLVEQVGVEILIGPSFISEVIRYPGIRTQAARDHVRGVHRARPGHDAARPSREPVPLLPGRRPAHGRPRRLRLPGGWGWRNVVLAGDAEARIHLHPGSGLRGRVTAPSAARPGQTGHAAPAQPGLRTSTSPWTPRRGIDGYVMPSFSADHARPHRTRHAARQPRRQGDYRASSPRASKGSETCFTGVVFGMPVTRPRGHAGGRRTARMGEPPRRFRRRLPGPRPVWTHPVPGRVHERDDGCARSARRRRRRPLQTTSSASASPSPRSTRRAQRVRSRLDANHQAVAPNYLHRIENGADGRLTTRTIEVRSQRRADLRRRFPAGRPSPRPRHDRVQAQAARRPGLADSTLAQAPDKAVGFSLPIARVQSLRVRYRVKTG